jgi:RND superfamily putative drug exporter
MALRGQPKSSSTPFRKLGVSVYRRRRYVVIAWVLALLVVVPFISDVSKVTSLQQGAATGSQLESVKASNIISSEFARTVPNRTLVVVISGGNVSSVGTQRAIYNFVTSLKHDPKIVGLNETVDVYSKLYLAIGGVNKAVFASIKGANGTTHLLLGVPALYFGVWQQAYASTQNVTLANGIANQTSAATLSKPNATAYKLYSSHVLSLFYSAWSGSWKDSANLTIPHRFATSRQTADAQYLSKYAPATKAFSDAVLSTITFPEFTTDTPAQWASLLARFAIGYVANNSAFSTRFVNATYSLGRTYDNSSLYGLTGNIVWNPGRYGVDQALSTLISSLVSPGRDTTLISLGLNRSTNQNLPAIRSDVRTASSNTSSSGIQSMLVTGMDAIESDFGDSTQADLALILPVTIALLLVATGIFFRSVLTPFITLGTIGVALGISQIFIILVGTYVAKVDFTIPTMLLTVLIGVGTDYSVFIIARYREERVRGLPVHQAVETSVTWAGESIATSGATVIISFLALALTSITFLRTVGMIVGLGVFVALSIALTLVPAVVSIVGGWSFWPNSGVRFAKYSASVLQRLERKRGYFSRSGAFAVKRAKFLIVLAIVATVPAVYVYATSTPTYDFLSAAPANLESISASNHLSAAFGGGKLFPTYVVLTFERPLVASQKFNSTEMGTIESISSHLASLKDVHNVTGPTRPFGTTVAYDSLNLTRPGEKRTFSAILLTIGKDNRTALITVNFGIDPYSTAAIDDTQAIRQYLHANYDLAGGVTGTYIGGASGSILDTKNVFNSQFDSIVPYVAVGVALVLLVVLGSLFLPVFAVLSVLMSIVWTISATKLVFQAYFNYQILFLLPFFLFVVLLGLGMDYNVFILTRIREEATKGKHLNSAIVSAIEQTGGIITAAAIILAGSLGALMLSSDLLLKELGFAFAFSILIDALIVRTYLVPAVMSVMGRWNWFSPIPYLNRSHALFEQM